MKAWPKTKLQKRNPQQGDIITKKIRKENTNRNQWENGKTKPTNAAGKCGKRQEEAGGARQTATVAAFVLFL